MLLLAAHESPAVMAHTRVSTVAAERNDADRAIGELQTAMDLDETHAETWARRAALHVREHRYEQGLADARRALELEPRHFAAVTLVGSALRGLRRFAEAREHFEDALRAHPWAPGVVTSIYQIDLALRIRSRADGVEADAEGRASETAADPEPAPTAPN